MNIVTPHTSIPPCWGWRLKCHTPHYSNGVGGCLFLCVSNSVFIQFYIPGVDQRIPSIPMPSKAQEIQSNKYTIQMSDYRSHPDYKVFLQWWEEEKKLKQEQAKQKQEDSHKRPIDIEIEQASKKAKTNSMFPLPVPGRASSDPGRDPGPSSQELIPVQELPKGPAYGWLYRPAVPDPGPGCPVPRRPAHDEQGYPPAGPPPFLPLSSSSRASSSSSSSTSSHSWSRSSTSSSSSSAHPVLLPAIPEEPDAASGYTDTQPEPSSSPDVQC
jgi:hypothetical protein